MPREIVKDFCSTYSVELNETIELVKIQLKFKVPNIQI